MNTIGICRQSYNAVLLTRLDNLDKTSVGIYISTGGQNCVRGHHDGNHCPTIYFANKDLKRNLF